LICGTFVEGARRQLSIFFPDPVCNAAQPDELCSFSENCGFAMSAAELLQGMKQRHDASTLQQKRD
jgi:hypothetical protein